ncbi:transcriptional regulator [Streptomyces macrosporus]|uniref:HTH cro/C1-type domain-containing protein n=1 Tax=Streptomyces macrosporus TaxID=44032 RepID=A0ABP5WDL7_9ACTN
MSRTDPYETLRDILARLSALLKDRGLARKDVVDPDKLSNATGLTVEEVRALLEGGTLPESEVDEITRDRVRFLYAKRHEGQDRKKATIIGEVATRLSVSKVWARQLLQGEKCPNVPHLKALSTYFGVPVAFFTDSAVDAVIRELGPILDELESDPLAELMEEFGIREVHARTDSGNPLTRHQKERLAAIIRFHLALGEGEPQR